LALADRVITYREGEFRVRKVLMLEPLLASVLSTDPTASLQALVLGLESNHISNQLIRKLELKKFLVTAKHLSK